MTTTILPPKVVGDLKCQHDSYLPTFTTRVVGCELYSNKPNGKKNKKSSQVETLYQVELEDTILFPEGGGQPCDLGFIGDVEVVDVQRNGLSCLHITKTPVEVGKEVQIKLDFERRWDLMQQHSGQHLISAVFEHLFEMDTVSWLLGETRSYVELPIKPKDLTNEKVKQVEKECNRIIRDSLPITVESYNLDDPSFVRPTSLPDDYVGGIVRYICIKDYDRNPCCGTHVSKTSHLQAVKFFQVESGNGNNSRLFFMVGERILNYVQLGFERELKLTSLLSSGPDDYAAKIQLLQQRGRDLGKQLKAFSNETALIVSEQISAKLELQPVVTFHRSNADPDFTKSLQFNLKPTSEVISAESSSPKAFLISSCPPNSVSGLIVVIGHPKLVPKIIEHISTIATLKGAMSGTSKWQGKCSDLDKLSQKYSSIELLFKEFTIEN